MAECFIGGVGRGTKVKNGSLSVTTTLQTVILGFTPDLVIIYDVNNNASYIAAGTSYASLVAVPRILTAAYSATDNGRIITNGFTVRTANGTRKLYYIAVKF